MSLRIQFEDLERELQRTLSFGNDSEEGFIECAQNAKAMNERYCAVKEELESLKGVVKDSKKEVGKLETRVKKESKKLKREQEKTLALKKETEALGAVLERARRVFMGGNLLRESLWSIISGDTTNDLSGISDKCSSR